MKDASDCDVNNRGKMFFHLTPEKANQRYFQNRRDGLSAAFLEQMMRSSV
jgi:hypothetical protein